MPDPEEQEPHARGALPRLLELVALAGIAVAEPVLAAFRDGADVFVLRRTSALEIVAWSLLVVLGPALVLWTVEAVVARLAPARLESVHGAFLGLLAALFALRAVYELGEPPRAVALGLAVAAGVAIAVLVGRVDGVATAVRLLAVLPALLLAQFLLTEPVSTLVLGDDGSGVGPAPVGNPVPVVLVVLDELPTASLLDEDDAISADQFPALARLADDATWFRNHTGVSPSTPTAVPAIMTGRYPTSTEAPPVADAHPDNLFTLLEGAYTQHVAEGATALCPATLCTGDGIEDRPSVLALLDDAVVLLGDTLAPTAEERRGDFAVRQSDPAAPETFEDFLDGVAPVDDEARPRLEALHLLYPHQPWFHLPDGADYEAPFVAKGLTSDYRWVSEAAAGEAQRRHLLQSRHADALLGRLLDRLEEQGRYDESLIVVTADHGVAFDVGEPIRGLSEGNAEQVMWTPLLVKEPGQTEGTIDERPVETVDILPTIADVLDLDLPDDVDGSSALAPAGADDGPDERVFATWTLNELQPPDGEILVPVDGRAGYRELLALPAPGQGDDPDLRFHRIGRWGGLVGREVDSLPAGPPSEMDVRATGLERFRDVELDAATVPAYLTGSSPPRVDADLAVSVNGVIAGWAETVDTGETGYREWWTMLAPSLLVDGANEVEVWEIVAPVTAGDDPVLRPVTILG